MNTKQFIFIITIIFSIVSCSEDTDVSVARNLQEYISENTNVTEKTVTAFAANAEANTGLTHIFYYPEEGASDVRYYELTDSSLDENDYVNYRRQSLDNQNVYGGKLKRFLRSGTIETWCLVTFKKEGVLKISAPIKLNNVSKPTTYSDEVAIAYTTTTTPNFIWEDSVISESVLYLQVISDEEDNFISGTFTLNKFFQYYDESNVINKIHEDTPQDLLEDEFYNFSILGINADNWVNLIINEEFIPRNLEEYIAVNSDKTLDTAIAFAGSANGNKEETYIYFHPIEGAFDYRYYETENTIVAATDYSNYKRRNLKEIAQFGGKFRRFSNNSSDEVWCLVTYIADGKLHISSPIKTKNNTRATEWSTDVAITYNETLKPLFTWSDGSFTENESYLQILTDNNDAFLSGTYTTEKTFEYYNEGNVTGKIHTVTPPDLVLDDDYKFSLFGLSTDNWVNLIIQNTFIAQ